MTNQFGGMFDHEVDKAAREGNFHAGMEQSRRFQHRSEMASGRGAAASASSGPSFLPFLVLALPVLAVSAAVSGLVNGVSWLALESPLSWLFPGPAADTPAYLLASITLLTLLPVSLWLAGLWLHGTRARALSWLVLPVATVLVPIVLRTTQETVSFGDPGTGAGVVSTALGLLLLVGLGAFAAWRRHGPGHLAALHRRAQRAGQRGDLARFVELQQRLVTRGLAQLGWRDPQMLEEALILAEGYKLLGQHPRSQHLTQVTFEQARIQPPETVRDLQHFARELML